MRKVLYKKWHPATYKDNRVDKTAHWDPEFIHQGLFHQWASGYEEFESGPGNYTYAIVENADGTIDKVDPIHIKFV